MRQHNLSLSRYSDVTLPEPVTNTAERMAQAVSRRLFNAQARFRSQSSPCGICVGLSGTRQVFVQVFRSSAVVAFALTSSGVRAVAPLGVAVPQRLSHPISSIRKGDRIVCDSDLHFLN